MSQLNLKEKIKQKVADYLKANDIEYKYLIEKESMLETTDSVTDTVYFTLPAIAAITMQVKFVLRFNEEYCYCQGFFGLPVMKDEDTDEEINRLCRLINHINSCLSASIYHSVMVLNDFDGNVYIGTLLRYELFDNFFEYTMDYILEERDMLNISCGPLFGYKMGCMTFDQAVDQINKAIDGE